MKTHKFYLNFFSSMVLVFLFSGSLQGKEVYLSLGGGYGLPTASANIGYYQDASSYSFELVKGTFGEGPVGICTIGVMLNQNVGLEIGVSGLWGSKKNWTSLINEYYSEYKSSQMRLIPAIKISTAGKNKLYLKMGCVIGLGGKLVYSTEQNYAYIKRTMEYTGGTAIGFMGGAGVELPVSNKLFFFSEIVFIAESWAPSHGELTRYIRNGIDWLPSTFRYEREFEYLSEVPNNSRGLNESSRELKEYFPMSSIALNIGIKFNLRGKTTASNPVTN